MLKNAQFRNQVPDLSLNPSPHQKFMLSVTGWKASCIQVSRKSLQSFLCNLADNPTKKQTDTGQEVAKFVTTDLKGKINNPSIVVGTLPSKTKKSTLRWRQRENQGIVKVSRIHLPSTANVCSTFHDNPSNICRGYFSLDQLTTADVARKYSNDAIAHNPPLLTPRQTFMYQQLLHTSLTHSFMHTFSKHCPPTLDPAATRCEGLASGERSSCRPPSSSLITLRQQGGTHKTRSVLACQNEKKITISPPRLLYHQREKEIERQAAAEQQLKPPFRALFETPACSKFKQIHRDGSIHMTRT